MRPNFWFTIKVKQLDSKLKQPEINTVKLTPTQFIDT